GAAGEHDRVDPLRLTGGEHPSAVRADAAPGEQPAGGGQIAAARLNRTLPEVFVEYVGHQIVEVAVAGEQVGDRGVAVAVFRLRGGDLRVGGDPLVAALGSQEFE